MNALRSVIVREEYRDAGIVFGITEANKGSWTPKGFCVSANAGIPLDDVQRCREALASELGFAELVTQHQVHGIGIQWVGRGSLCDAVSDALITTDCNVLLTASVADCAGVVLYDIESGACAVVHSGWRGTKQGIVSSCVSELVRQSRGSASRLKAWCSPCASGERYEVQQDVQQFFEAYCTPCADGSYLFDNQAAIVDQLLSAGLLAENITTSRRCTIADTRLHSFRRDAAHSGRMVVFVGRHCAENSIVST